MTEKRQCVECGTPLSVTDTAPLCPACIFRRLAGTGSTIYPPQELDSERGSVANHAPPELSLGAPESRSGTHETNFYSEYELLGEIGRGGMGVIYKAHQPELNRTVALKVIHAAGLAGDGGRRRFQAEVKVAARLNHPGIVPIFDVGLLDGCPCFSMEFFPGGSLADRLRQPGLSIEKGVRLLTKVVRAVYFAHQHGVLHRDLKPANILLDANGDPHVADFGLAKELDSGSDLTRSGAALGSPCYMSPEQAAGKAESLTVATDIYSLGAMLYEMLTGRPPFLAATPLETMRLAAEQEAPRPSSLVARADRDLETICLKCLEKDPARRYTTAGDLTEDLERWLRHEPILARPSNGIERLWKWARRRTALATLTAALHIVLVAGIAGVLWQWRQAEQARYRESQQLRRAETALAHSAISLAEASLREGNGPAARAALDIVPDAFRDRTWHYLLAESDPSRPLPDLGLQQLNDLAAHPGRPSVFAAADHGGRIVFFDVRNGSRLLEFAPGFEVADSGTELRIAFSKTGDRLAIGRTGSGGIVIHDAGNGRKMATWDAPASGRLEFSPDASMLLQINADKEHLEMWDVARRASRWRHDDADYAATFASDGGEVICYSRREQLRIVQASDGTPVTGLSKNHFEQISVQSDGMMLVAGNPLGTMAGFDLSSGRQTMENRSLSSPIRYVTFLPGGDRFLTATALPDNTFALQRWDLTLRQLLAVAGARGDIRNICVHPLTGELIVCAQEDRVWETTGVPPLRVIQSRHRRPSAAFWGTDDTLFAPGADETGAVFQSISDSNAPTALWTAGGRVHGEVNISADGHRAAVGWFRATRPIVVLERNGTEITEVASLQPAGLLDYVRLSPNGDRLIAVEGDLTQLEVFQVAPGAPAAALDVSDVREFADVAWLDGGRRLVGVVTTYSPQRSPNPSKQVILWDATTGQRLVVATNHANSRVARSSPDGRRFAEGDTHRNVRIRDGATLEVLREFRAHNAPVSALAWHPTRPILATASADLTIRFWNLENGSRLEELSGPLSPPIALSFSPGGTRLAAAARDQVVRIWEPRSLAPPR